MPSRPQTLSLLGLASSLLIVPFAFQLLFSFCKRRLSPNSPQNDQPSFPLSWTRRRRSFLVHRWTVDLLNNVPILQQPRRRRWSTNGAPSSDNSPLFQLFQILRCEP